MRRLVAVCGVLVGTLVLGACGGARLDAREPASSNKDLLGLMPEASFALVHADVAELRSSPYGETVAGWYRKWAEFAAESDDELRGTRVVEEMLSHADTIVGGVEAPGEKGDAREPDFVVVTRGEFERGQVESWLRKLPQMGDAIEVVEREDHRVLLVQGVAGVRLDARTWAWTPADRVPALLERMRSPGRGPRSDALRAMYERLGARDTGLRVALETKPSLREELEAEQLLDAPWKKSIRVSGFRLAVSEGVDMEFVGVTKNSEAARRLRDALADMTARYEAHPFAVLLGFDMLLESTQWKVEGSAAVAQSTLDDTRTRQLLFHLERLGRGVLGLIRGEGSGALDALAGDFGASTRSTELAPARAESAEERSVSSIVGDVQRFRVSVGDAQPTKGPADAPVTIVVFSDFQCPYCARVREGFERVRREYGDDVRLVWRNRPLPFHRKARPAARAAMEAFEQGDDKMFWQMHGVLFDHQESLSRSDLETYAEQVGLDMKAFRTALDDKEHEPVIEADEELAGELQVRGTPQMFINGRRLRGAKPFSEFEKIIDDELRRAKRLRARGVSRERVYATFMKHADSEPKSKSRTPDRVQEREEHDLSVPKDAPRRGSLDAPVIIQEFGDFQCPYCAKAAPVVDKIKETYGDRVTVVWRNYPLPFHDDAALAHQAAMEVYRQGGNDKFWAYHDKLFAHQDALEPIHLRRYAREVGGIDLGELRRALDKGRHEPAVGQDKAAIEEEGLRIGTPSFFINGRLLKGAQPFAEFEKRIEAELGGAGEGDEGS